MRASTARLMNSPIRLAELSFPQAGRLVHRTRLAFIHLDNLLAFGKRDRDGRVDGYLTVYLPDECLIVFLRKGDAVNAASLHTTGRQVITITEALKRMRSEVERGELAYCMAPMVQLAWMYQSCAVELQPRTLDLKEPGTFFPSLRQERVTGVIELISDGRVSYLRFDGGRFEEGYFCDKPEDVPVATFLESQFRSATGGHAPALSAVVFPAVSDLPAQAPTVTHQHVPRAVLAHLRRSGEGIPRPGAAPGPKGVHRHHGDAQGARAAQRSARHGDARSGRPAGGSVQRVVRLVAAAARGRGGDDAGHRAENSEGGDEGAPLRAAVRRILRPSAVAIGVVRCAGTLYVVATPLGNLDDLSPRAAATLCRVTTVAAEDTRRTKTLMVHVGSSADLMSFHAHSTDAALQRILHLLGTGKDVALVTDAGTPTVSDPGALLVAAARARDVPVVSDSRAHRRGRGPVGVRDLRRPLPVSGLPAAQGHATGAACLTRSRRASGPSCCSKPQTGSSSC